MRLNVRREQIEVMNAVAEVNFERRLALHLRENYRESVVKLPDGGEFTVGTLMAETLERLVAVGIARAKQRELTLESTISLFVALMFHVAPNFDRHRLCEVMLGDEDKTPDERLEEIPKVLSDSNWETIRKGYDPTFWEMPAEPDEETVTEGDDKPASAAASDPMDRTIPNLSPATPVVKLEPLTGGLAPQPAIDDLEATILNIDVKE